MWAVVKIKGHQYLVKEKTRLTVQSLGAKEGDTVDFGDVLLVADANEVKIGKPFVKGAKVEAKVLGSKRGDKVIVFKYKSKTRYRVKRGFRAKETQLQIQKISA